MKGAKETWVNKGTGSAFIAFVIYSSYFEKGRTGSFVRACNYPSAKPNCPTYKLDE